MAHLHRCTLCLQVETTTALGIKKTHVQYVIRVDSSIPGMIANGVEVRRRFSDFDVSAAAPTLTTTKAHAAVPVARAFESA